MVSWNLNTLLRRWLYTPIIIWQGDWILREWYMGKSHGQLSQFIVALTLEYNPTLTALEHPKAFGILLKEHQPQISGNSGINLLQDFGYGSSQRKLGDFLGGRKNHFRVNSTHFITVRAGNQTLTKPMECEVVFFTSIRGGFKLF